MKRLLFLCSLVIDLAIVLTACGPAALDSPTAGEITPIVVTMDASTAVVGTVEPVFITDLPPDYTPPPTPIAPTLTPIPSLPDGISPSELKYRVLAEFPDFFFCDPDFYPVARDDELDLARQRFPELQANTEEFNAILAHNNLDGRTVFNDEQKLLIYREHKRLAAIQFELVPTSYRFQIQVAKTEGEGELITGLIDSQGEITVQQKEQIIATCPICLAAGTLIDTPGGPTPVESLRVGTPVWTVDKDGARIAQPVIKVAKMVTTKSHRVVHLILDDGRELWASPGHPTIDGRRIGQFKVGDLLDGAQVLLNKRVRYSGDFTYDLLPAGETGFYWANGILIASAIQDP